MHLFGGRSRDDREHLVQTLRSLGPTSIGGLSAALSWPPRRTVRAAREAVRWGSGAIEYEPSSGRIGFRSAPPSAPAAPPASAEPPKAPAPKAVPPPLPKAWNASPKCPICHIAFVSTGTGSGVYCPNCGRLSIRSGDAPPLEAPATAPAASTPVPTRHGPATTLGDDRHSQELFAAWVTSRPIPCPKCRTSLRHKGVGQYACPACGAQVAFEGPLASSRPSPPSAAPGPAAPGTSVPATVR